MKYFYILLSAFSILTSCKKNKDVLDDLEPGTIENQIFNSTVLIDGHDYDGTIIRNCVFENIDGDGLQIRDVNNLCIENCTFKDISEDAIRFRNSGSSSGVKIIDNDIHDIEENGILAWEEHYNTLIKGNHIWNVATNNTSSIGGAPHHGIYFQGPNAEITENEIHDVINSNGNCISIRTYGKIHKNRLYNATDHGISYFSDHPGNNLELLIENNFIYDNGQRGVNLTSNGTNSNHIGSALVRFNTIITDSKSPIGVNDELNDVTLQFDGNILVRTDGQSTFIFSSNNFTSTNNLTSSGDIGFVNYGQRDLHINTTSTAIGFSSGIATFPADDIDGNTRDAADLEAGADEL